MRASKGDGSGGEVGALKMRGQDNLGAFLGSPSAIYLLLAHACQHCRKTRLEDPDIL